MNGVELIAAERTRQVGVEGWSPEHDDEHGDGELAVAAACYAVPRGSVAASAARAQHWPFEPEAWKPGDRIRELAKAGALIAAEIDRLQRANAQEGEQ